MNRHALTVMQEGCLLPTFGRNPKHNTLLGKEFPRNSFDVKYETNHNTTIDISIRHISLASDCDLN